MVRFGQHLATFGQVSANFGQMLADVSQHLATLGRRRSGLAGTGQVGSNPGRRPAPRAIVRQRTESAPHRPKIPRRPPNTKPSARVVPSSPPHRPHIDAVPIRIDFREAQHGLAPEHMLSGMATQQGILTFPCVGRPSSNHKLGEACVGFDQIQLSLAELG